MSAALKDLEPVGESLAAAIAILLSVRDRLPRGRGEPSAVLDAAICTVMEVGEAVSRPELGACAAGADLAIESSGTISGHRRPVKRPDPRFEQSSSVRSRLTLQCHILRLRVQARERAERDAREVSSGWSANPKGVR